MTSSDRQQSFNNSTPAWPKSLGRWTVGLTSATGSVVIFFIFFKRVQSQDNNWEALALTSVLIVVAFAVAALLQFALAPLVPRDVSDRVPVDPEVAIRSRIAPLVIGLGAAAISIIALGIIITLALLSVRDETLRGNIDTLLTGIFSAVLPVFATWVGTVIAFYFTESAYREASQSTRAAIGVTDIGKPKVGDRMMSYDSINKIEVEKRTDADILQLSELRNRLSDNVERMYIFERPRRNPIYIIRKEYIDLLNDDTKKVFEYREHNAKIAADSKNIAFVKAEHTIEQANQIMLTTGVRDAFVTRNGQASEEVLGWVSCDMVKQNRT